MTLPALPALLVRLVLVVGAAIGVAAVATVGLDRLVVLARSLRPRLRETAPYFGLLVAVLLFNSVARSLGTQLSWMFGVNVTGTIYAIEGGFVATLQSYATPWLTAYFSGVYVYGYAFLLVFPFVAYLALDDLRPVRTATLAYSFNYVIGLVCYLVFIAYGPRNLMPDLVESLLYSSWPESKLLTTRVNVSTNVFPSLHSSLSATVALLAYRTRDRYPVWFYVAAVLAASVVVSTMYLGIHWLTDVVAGVALAAVSVRMAAWAVAGQSSAEPGTTRGRAADAVRRGLAGVRSRLSRGR